jgi:hypothetical protein
VESHSNIIDVSHAVRNCSQLLIIGLIAVRKFNHVEPGSFQIYEGYCMSNTSLFILLTRSSLPTGLLMKHTASNFGNSFFSDS